MKEEDVKHNIPAYGDRVAAVAYARSLVKVHTGTENQENIINRLKKRLVKSVKAFFIWLANDSGSLTPLVSSNISPHVCDTGNLPGSPCTKFISSSLKIQAEEW